LQFAPPPLALAKVLDPPLPMLNTRTPPIENPGYAYDFYKPSNRNFEVKNNY